MKTVKKDIYVKTLTVAIQHVGFQVVVFFLLSCTLPILYNEYIYLCTFFLKGKVGKTQCVAAGEPRVG